MTREKVLAPILATGLLLAGCTSSGETESPSTPPAAVGLEFQKTPEHNYTAGSCRDKGTDYASDRDLNPQDVEESSTTVGVKEGVTPAGAPIFEAGVTYQGQGDAVYAIGTSEDLTGQTHSEVIDLKLGGFALVLAGPQGLGYDVGLTARLADDGTVYFRALCLPEAGYIGDEEHPVPLDLTPAPSTEPTPTEQTPVPSQTLSDV